MQAAPLRMPYDLVDSASMARSSLTLTATVSRRELVRPFSISTGARTYQDMLSVQLTDGSVSGRGEATGLAYRGETPDVLLNRIKAMRTRIERGLTRDALLKKMPPDGARFALDSALWELDAARAGTDVAGLLGLDPAPVASAFTIVLDAPEAMAAQTRQEAWRPLLKVKLGGSPDEEVERMTAVAAQAGSARLVADANAGWTPDSLRLYAPIAARLGFELIEQPLPMGCEGDPDCAEALRDAARFLPVCADESFRTADDLKRLAPLYQAVNIKLDKCGGLTAALRIRDQARAAGLKTFIGCMLAPTTAIAPAHLLAQDADYADLDGPFWFPDEPVRLDEKGLFAPVSPAVWGRGVRSAND